MPKFCFEGTASWKSGIESDLTIKRKRFITVSPPPEFDGVSKIASQKLETFITGPPEVTHHAVFSVEFKQK